MPAFNDDRDSNPQKAGSEVNGVFTGRSLM